MKTTLRSTEVFHRHAGQDWPSAEDCEVCFLQRQIRDQDKRVCDQADTIRNLEKQIAHYEARVAELEVDAARYRWLRECVTFYDIDADWPVDAPNVPVLAQVSERIWYHATDDIHSLSLDALIDAALAGKQPQEGE